MRNFLSKDLFAKGRVKNKMTYLYGLNLFRNKLPNPLLLGHFQSTTSYIEEDSNI
jgi:hypothetical protein